MRFRFAYRPANEKHLIDFTTRCDDRLNCIHLFFKSVFTQTEINNDMLIHTSSREHEVHHVVVIDWSVCEYIVSRSIRGNSLVIGDVICVHSRVCCGNIISCFAGTFNQCIYAKHKQLRWYSISVVH